MSRDQASEPSYFLSTLTATKGQRRLASVIVALSLVGFVVIAPFAGTPLGAGEAFIPAYQSSLVVLDLITVALLLNQYSSFSAPSLLVLASGYLFTAITTVVHMLTFPGLFSPTGLLGSGPQTTAWLYMFWHGGFPLCVTTYALMKRRETHPPHPTTRLPVFVSTAFAIVLTVVTGISVLAIRGGSLLPPIMAGSQYTPAMTTVVSTVWLLSAVALLTLWLHKPHAVLDLWLMVTMCAWLIDVALSALLNHGRFDLGFYAGRIYGLFAASFVLLVLLAESGMLYKRLVRLTLMLQRLTTQDALTGIANRRAFDRALDLEWHLAMRSGLPLSLLMLDVDHFKAFNDTYGHVEGDKCLKTVANTLQASITRAPDLVARYGGEEFVILLPQTSVEAAGGIAERIRDAIATLAIPNRRSDTGHVTVSVGVACVRSAWIETERNHVHTVPAGGVLLVEMADRLLYQAKSSGRNRVVIGSCEPQPEVDAADDAVQIPPPSPP
ncbi:sensor domain-containing diguanylate cyclase [Azoarcus sp. KH32C]|uniref:sensor domain-containing diguanylate cyclase n=1 Tax=Azoarcus sp. KH32C TaxID=748247 RepID=UPI0002386125|nr:sensor domain-containing diguanylate cyclase [Azoarcus sp. KH32C]BAL24047.1 putative diguanylate cyclase [Azoarcus sp. KH32C]